MILLSCIYNELFIVSRGGSDILVVAGIVTKCLIECCATKCCSLLSVVYNKYALEMLRQNSHYLFELVFCIISLICNIIIPRFSSETSHLTADVYLDINSREAVGITNNANNFFICKPKGSLHRGNKVCLC